MSSSGEPVLYEADSTSGFARVTINRPERRNAINADVIEALIASLDTAEKNDRVKALVLTGAGDKAFCAGGDLGAVGGEREGRKFPPAELGELFARLRDSRLPVIARVNGSALGGGFGLMLACDLVVAADHSEFALPEIKVGLWPFIVTAVARRDLPRKVALDLMLTGRRISASDGLRWGFVNRVVAGPELDRAIDDLATMVAANSPLVVELGKQSFYRSEGRDFEEAIDYLAGMLTLCLQSEDTSEGISAWLEKRAPQWKGR